MYKYAKKQDDGRVVRCQCSDSNVDGDVMFFFDDDNVAPGVALLVTGMILNWELGLVMLACFPFVGLSVAVLAKLMSSSAQEGSGHYSKAGGVATEVRVVMAKNVFSWSCLVFFSFFLSFFFRKQ